MAPSTARAIRVGSVWLAEVWDAATGRCTACTHNHKHQDTALRCAEKMRREVAETKGGQP